ncbi:DUF927 domain-containing protein [Leclercia adecarboxylata ATCC 23216 = NBRC 102595]|nr:DUF927 domain-containing protein [Leclercia adecarboxylata ATCC 23216 = NBRC 102595]
MTDVSIEASLGDQPIELTPEMVAELKTRGMMPSGKARRPRKAKASASNSNVVGLDTEAHDGIPYIAFLPNKIRMRTTRMVKGEEIEDVADVCDGYLRIIGYAVDENGDALRVAEIKNRISGKLKNVVLTMAEIGTREGWATLRKNDVFPLPKHYETFSRYLAGSSLYDTDGIDCGHLPSWVVMTKPGWHNGAFILPNGDIINPEKGETPNVICDLKHQPDNASVGCKGTSKSWVDNVGSKIKGNDTLMMAVGVALAGPMLKLVGADGFGVHFWQPSSQGKTTALHVANSIYGNPEERKKSWNNTTFKLAMIAAANNDMFYGLDELKQCKPRELQPAIYCQFNQQMRGGMNKDRTENAAVTWNNTMMSTGELTVERHIQLMLNEVVDAGALVRLLNIHFRAPQKCWGFEDVEGEKQRGKLFAKYLNKQTQMHYGTFGRDWIGFLAANPGTVIEVFEKATARWNDITKDKHGQAGRVAANFALVEAALKAASKPLDLSHDEIEAVLESFFESWLNDFSSDDALTHEQSGVIERAIHTMTQVGHFIAPGIEITANVNDLWGYMREDKFYLLPQAFTKYIAMNMDPTEAARVLADRGMLSFRTETKDGKTKRRYSYQNVAPYAKSDKRISTYCLTLPAEEADTDSQ